MGAEKLVRGRLRFAGGSRTSDHDVLSDCISNSQPARLEIAATSRKLSQVRNSNSQLFRGSGGSVNAKREASPGPGRMQGKCRGTQTEVCATDGHGSRVSTTTAKEHRLKSVLLGATGATGGDRRWTRASLRRGLPILLSRDSARCNFLCARTGRCCGPSDRRIRPARTADPGDRESCWRHARSFI
jgi:hypothetical protein